MAGNRRGAPVFLGNDVTGDPSQTLAISHTQFGSAFNYVNAGNNILDPDPVLGPLADNGGPTRTMAISTASPAYNSGSSTEQDDQRGVPRPQNGSDDIGAFELDDTAPSVSISSLGTTKNTTPQFDFSSPDPDVAGFECALDGPTQAPLGATYEPCSSPVALGPLADGAYTLRVRVSDIAGNVGAASESFAVDTRVEGFAKARRAQKQKRRKIVVKVTVGADESLRAKATGTIRVKKRNYRLKARNISIVAGSKKTLKLKPKKSRQARKIATALKRGKKAKARLEVRLTDGAGNAKVARLKVRLKR